MSHHGGQGRGEQEARKKRRANAFMRELAGQQLIANRSGLLHTKTKDKGTTSGYFGAATHGYNLAAIEVLQPGLGVFLDTIYVAFKMRRGGIVKTLQHCEKVGRFPLNNDGPRDNRQKWNCRDCGGTGQCKHGRPKGSCRDCGTGQYCEHGCYNGRKKGRSLRRLQ
jgi:hypothetical protein